MKYKAVAALFLALILSGCSLSSLSMSPDPPEAPRKDKDTVVEKKPSELDLGSTEHRITAQGKTLVLEYSTEQNPLTWTKDKRANIWLYASMPKENKDLKVLVTYVKVEYDDGVSVLEDSGSSYTITPPYTFGTVIAAWPSKLNITVDILIETEEGSGEFFKQRFVDTLKLTPAE